MALAILPHALSTAAIMQRLFQGIGDEPRMGRRADPPAQDAAGTGVDDEGDMDRAMGTPLVRVTLARAAPGGDTGEIADPEHVGHRHAELAVHLVLRLGRLSVRDRRPVRLSADNGLNPHALHPSCPRASRDIKAPSAISLETPALLPLSPSAFLTPLFRACPEQPIFAATDRIACQRDPC